MKNPSIPEPNARLRSAVRWFYAWIGSLALLAGTSILGGRLIHQPTTSSRIAAAAIGIGGLVPWMVVVFAMIRRGDEYTRRIHLVALGFAFGGTLLLLSALAWLVRAELIEPPDLMIVWLGCLVLWFAAIMGAKRYFERGQ